MADILKITTPLTPKSHTPQVHKNIEAEANFQLSDISKVIKPNSETGVNSQNSGFVDKDSTNTLLANLLKDPAVTITYLKNIFLLQEVVKLLPVNNSTFTQEIQLLFDSLLIPIEEVVSELKRQEQSSTAFKGELFDFLRSFLSKNRTIDSQNAIANFLKALNGQASKDSILTSIENCLKFIKGEMSSSDGISSQIEDVLQKLDQLVAQTRAATKNNDSKGPQLKGQMDLMGDDLESMEQLNTEKIRNTSVNKTAEQIDFKTIKQGILELIGKIEESILYNSKIDKISSMMVYNLSRFRDNPMFLREATDILLTYINKESDKIEFINLLKGFLNDVVIDNTQKSKIMMALSEIMEKQAFSKEVTAINSDKIEKIINSLLSSPCSFTPLLHFIVPVEYMNMKSFAEIWIDADEDSEIDERTGEKEDNLHMLIVFEVEGIGQFESEIFVRGKDITLQLFCPNGYKDSFQKLEEKLKDNVKGTSYTFKEIVVDTLKKQRSLMDAFKDLPRKRTGLDIIC